MHSYSKAAALCLFGAVTQISATTLITFDGASGTTYTFKELNDPVMGGESTGTWSVNKTGQFGVFDGDVVDVPSLKAPGFIKAAADGKFPDVGKDIMGGLVLRVRSSTPSYTGFRVTFASGTLSPDYACAGGGSIPFSRGCFKAHFSVPAGDDFTDVVVPFSAFSDKWSPATGQHTKNCTDDKDVCPTAKSLADIKRFEVWGEGVGGKLHLEIQSISTSNSPDAGASITAEAGDVRPPKEFEMCSAAVQAPLQYGISGRTQATVPVPVEEGESLAEAVCCDSRVKPFAEPQFLFQAPDINLFAKMDQSGVTTFYDSVCGLPLFKTPVNRTLADFKEDTTEHGWPSFRDGEVFHENVVTNVTTTYVTSKCGTHLGSYLPDSKGSRWCIDLSCISGFKV